MPTCPICSKEMKYINNSHLKSHGLTPTEFKVMYPDVESMSVAVKEKRNNNLLLGEKNLKKIISDKNLLFINHYNNHPKKCKNCLNHIPFEKRRNNFCGHSCATSFTNKNREVKYTIEAKEKLRNIGLALSKIPCHEKRTKVIYENTCAVCSKLFFPKANHKATKTCSLKCRKKYQSINNYKQNKTFGNCGYYRGVYCASSWELAFLIYNLDAGREIKRCELTFSYLMEDEEKTYFPDFLMEDKIYEVKGRELSDVAIKTQAVVDAGYQIELIRKKEITPIIKFLKEKYKVKDLTELYDKKE